MRLAVFDNYRLGVVDGDSVVDVTDALEYHDTDWPFAFIPKMIMSFDWLRPRIETLAASGRRIPLSQVKLRPPVPGPTNVAAAASNYRAHNAEMQKYLAENRFGQTGSGTPQSLKSTLSSVPGRPPGERGEVFLKSPSSIIGPGDTIFLPDTTPGREVHHEPELAAVISKECYRISPSQALDYVFGYCALLDITVRGDGDRSRRVVRRAGCCTGTSDG